MAKQGLEQRGKASDLVLFFQRGHGSPVFTPKVTGVTAYLPAFKLKSTAGPYQAQIIFLDLPVPPGTWIDIIAVSPDGQKVQAARLTRRRGEYVVGENYIPFTGLGDAGATSPNPWIPIAAGAGILGLIFYNFTRGQSDVDSDGDDDDGDEDDEDDEEYGYETKKTSKEDDDEDDDESCVDDVADGDEDGDTDEDDGGEEE